MENGKFGVFGGQYVPETLMTAVHEVEAAYTKRIRSFRQNLMI